MQLLEGMMQRYILTESMQFSWDTMSQTTHMYVKSVVAYISRMQSHEGNLFILLRVILPCGNHPIRGAVGNTTDAKSAWAGQITPIVLEKIARQQPSKSIKN